MRMFYKILSQEPLDMQSFTANLIGCRSCQGSQAFPSVTLLYNHFRPLGNGDDRVLKQCLGPGSAEAKDSSVTASHPLFLSKKMEHESSYGVIIEF